MMFLLREGGGWMVLYAYAGCARLLFLHRKISSFVVFQRMGGIKIEGHSIRWLGERDEGDACDLIYQRQKGDFAYFFGV